MLTEAGLIWFFPNNSSGMDEFYQNTLFFLKLNQHFTRQQTLVSKILSLLRRAIVNRIVYGFLPLNLRMYHQI